MSNKDKDTDESKLREELREALRKERDGRAKQSKLDEKEEEWKEWGK